jgi:sugar/nucleoside kinase (ribokinase family)
MPDVVVVGDINTDVLAVAAARPETGTDTAAAIRLAGGGSAANTAAWLAHAGTSVTLVAAVGTDAAGDARLAELAAAGVTCAVARVPAATGTVVVLSDPGERTMLTDRGANAHLSAAHVTAAIRSSGARHLHLSAYPLLDAASRPAALAALREARAAGLTTSVDAASAAPLRTVADAFPGWVRGTDLLLANTDEARVLLGGTEPTKVEPAKVEPADAARRLTALARRVVVKHGAAGAVSAGPDGTVEAPGVPVTAVDPTGAGDAFAAGFLTAWLSGADPATALRAGTELGARATASLGARP